MSENVIGRISQMGSINDLIKLETNIDRLEKRTPEVSKALEEQYAELGREYITTKIDLDITNLSPAENKVLYVLSRYAGIQRKNKKSITYALRGLENNGFLDAAEKAVIRSKPTKGYEVLLDEDLSELSYEQIIVDHPEEFSDRALWYAKRTLGIDTLTDTPPADRGTITQIRTEEILDWLSKKARENNGILSGHTNEDVAKVVGLEDMARNGRVLGNIQSRIDLACGQSNLPPLGLCVTERFSNSWQNKFNWDYPLNQMILSSQSRVWSDKDFESIRLATRKLSGSAAKCWREWEGDTGNSSRNWANSLQVTEASGQSTSTPNSPDIEKTAKRIARTMLKTVFSADGRETTRTAKVKNTDLSEEECIELVGQLYEQQNGVCAYSNLKIQLDGFEDDEEMLASLDRVDSEGHYTPENLQLVCRFINRWKSNDKHDLFKRLLSKLQD